MFANRARRNPEGSPGGSQLFRGASAVAPSHSPHAESSRHKVLVFAFSAWKMPKELFLRNKVSRLNVQHKASTECGECGSPSRLRQEAWNSSPAPVCSLLCSGRQHLPALLPAVDLKWSPRAWEHVNKQNPRSASELERTVLFVF